MRAKQARADLPLYQLTGGFRENTVTDRNHSAAYIGGLTLALAPSTSDRLSAGKAIDYGPGGIKDGYPPSTITTVDPETDWPEVAGDAARDGAGATYGAFRGGVRHPGLLAEVFVTGALISAANNVETETVPNPDALSNSERYGQNDSDNQGAISSGESAEGGNWGTDPEGDFGDSSTQPSTGSGTTDSGLSTSLEAANEYSNGNTGGEYGGTPTAPETASQPTPSRPSRGSSNTDGESNSRGGAGVSSSQSAADGGWGSSQGREFD